MFLDGCLTINRWKGFHSILISSEISTVLVVLSSCIVSADHHNVQGVHYSSDNYKTTCSGSTMLRAVIAPLD